MMINKFLIVDNSKYQELQEEILVFLWDNGKEIMMNTHYDEEGFSRNFTFEDTCIITFGEKEINFFQEKEDVLISKNLIIYNSTNLHFSKTGIYSNLLPYPHKLFELKSLETSELNIFFQWCINSNFLNKMHYSH